MKLVYWIPGLVPAKLALLLLEHPQQKAFCNATTLQPVVCFGDQIIHFNTCMRETTWTPVESKVLVDTFTFALHLCAAFIVVAWPVQVAARLFGLGPTRTGSMLNIAKHCPRRDVGSSYWNTVVTYRVSTTSVTVSLWDRFISLPNCGCACSRLVSEESLTQNRTRDDTLNFLPEPKHVL